MEKFYAFRKMVVLELAKIKLWNVGRYATEMENTNTFKLEELSRDVDEAEKSLTEEEKEMYWEYKIEEFEEVEKIFPSFLRYSVVVLIYSIIEEALLGIVKPHIVNSLGDKKESELNRLAKNKVLKYKGDNFLDKLGNYMEQEMGIEFPFDSKEWIFVMDLNTIRNNIVHCNGKVKDDKDPENIQNVLDSYNAITVSSHGEMILAREFITYMIEQIQALFSELIKTNK
ncbi:hypothetical protein [Bacillus sp. DE0042]|uniref:hypothetical protein n=1 Tax=Bacillus sp. DE0042 TaxID=2584950 RepID=UPI0021B58442|nr:hypothetical protein [Bacillus sp. DE0042]